MSDLPSDISTPPPLEVRERPFVLELSDSRAGEWWKGGCRASAFLRKDVKNVSEGMNKVPPSEQADDLKNTLRKSLVTEILSHHFYKTLAQSDGHSFMPYPPVTGVEYTLESIVRKLKKEQSFKLEILIPLLDDVYKFLSYVMAEIGNVPRGTYLAHIKQRFHFAQLDVNHNYHTFAPVYATPEVAVLRIDTAKRTGIRGDTSPNAPCARDSVTGIDVFRFHHYEGKPVDAAKDPKILAQACVMANVAQVSHGESGIAELTSLDLPYGVGVHVYQPFTYDDQERKHYSEDGESVTRSAEIMTGYPVSESGTREVTGAPVSRKLFYAWEFDLEYQSFVERILEIGHHATAELGAKGKEFCMGLHCKRCKCLSVCPVPLMRFAELGVEL